MNTKSIVFLAAIALVLVGCNKEKEENIGTPVISVGQQQQVSPGTNAVPATASEQNQVIPQAPQEVATASSQAAPIADSQNQIQPVPAAPIPSQQGVVDDVSATQAPATAPVAPVPTTAPEVVPPQGAVVSGPNTPATPGTGGLVTANEPAQQPVVPGVSTGKADVVGTKVSFRVSSDKKDNDTNTKPSRAKSDSETSDDDQ
ncbi:MAG: hypothetical protein WCH10_04515 [bacterium]